MNLQYLELLKTDPRTLLDTLLALTMELEGQRILVTQLEDEVSGFSEIGGIPQDLEELEEETERLERITLAHEELFTLIVSAIKPRITPFGRN